MILRLLPLIFSWLLMAAHFSRADNNILAILSLMIPFLLLIKRKWSYYAVISLTCIASVIWVFTTFSIIHLRIQAGDEWARMALILFGVAAFTLVAALLLLSKNTRSRYQ